MIRANFSLKMKFLKVFFNSLLGGILFSCLITLLVMDLNTYLPFTFSFFLTLSLYLTLTYGLLVSLVSMLFFFIVQFFSGRKINIPLVSPSFLTISFTMLFILFFHLFRQNYRLFLTLFSPEGANLLKAQSQTIIYIATLGILVSFANFAYKKKVIFSIIYFCLFAAAMVYVVYQRVNYPALPQYEKAANLEAKDLDKRVTIIGLEGLSFDFIIPLISEGKLPNFAWLMEEGSWGNLESFTPNEPLILSHSFNSGKLPAKHLQLSPYEYHILNMKQGFNVVPRYILFKQHARFGFLRAVQAKPPARTKDLWDIFGENRTTYLKRDGYDLAEEIGEEITPETETIFNRFFEDLRFETSEIFSFMKRAFCVDVELEARVTREKEEIQPQLLYFLLPGLDVTETYFYKYSFPELFGEVDQEELNKYSTLIERHYQFYDEIIGKYLASKKDNELLVVYAPHGIEPLSAWKRVIEWLLGNPQVSAFHENAPDGAVFFIGKDIVKGNNVEGMRLIDIAPTLLHYLGLPVGKDMDGIVSSSVFVEKFKNENPVLYISSYEEHDIKSP